VLGRETFLAPVDWVDGWPRVGPVEIDMVSRPAGRAEPEYAGERDDFDQPALDHRWAAVRRPPASLSSLVERPGWLSLLGTEATLDSTCPVLVGRRQQHQTCRVRCLVDLAGADEAGLTVLMNEQLHTDVAVTADRVIARSRIGPLSGIVGETTRSRLDQPMVLVIETVLTGEGPDTIVVGFEDPDGTTQVLAELDGRYLSTEVAGGFMGRMIGMYAVGGTAHFDWFDYASTTQP
jgi:beta-xylosidase